MFKNIVFFRVQPDSVIPSVHALEEALELQRFTPCAPTQRQSSGWVHVRNEDHSPLVENVGGELIFKLMVESKMLPASVVKDKLEERIKKVKEETGRERIGGKEKRDLKEAIEHELLPQAFTKKGATMMWLSEKAGFIVVAAGSVKKTDAIITALCEAVSHAGGQLNVIPVRTQVSPTTAMSHWLTTREAPQNFSVDRDCELKSSDDNATVRYARHNLEIDEVVEHIKVQGKEPTKLALTHASRVSFVLANDLTLKKLEMLGVVYEESKKEDAGFEADIAIITGELKLMLPDLIDALGGELGADGASNDESPAEPQSSDLALAA